MSADVLENEGYGRPDPRAGNDGITGSAKEVYRTQENKSSLIRIETGTPEGDSLGFTDDLFSGWLELDRENKRLYLHYLISREKNSGNTQNLIRSWIERGYDVRIVMPRPIMQHILQKFGFLKGLELFPDQYEGKVEVWKGGALS